jgi:hypothetical protein
VVEVSDPRPERPVRVGGVLALVASVLATAALTGAMAGPPGVLAGLVGGLSAVGVGAGLRSLVGDDNRSRALGSAGVALGGAGVVTAVGGLSAAAELQDSHLLGHPMTGGADAGVLLVAVAGVLAAAADAFVESPSHASEEVSTTIWRSGHILAVGGTLGYLAAVGVFIVVPLAALELGNGVFADAAASTTAGGAALATAVFALEVLAVLVLGVVRLAVPTLNEWVASATTTREDETEFADLLRVLPNPRRWPTGAWKLLGGQVFVLLLFTDTVGRVVTSVLTALGPLGDAVQTVVSTGALHWPLFAVGALAAVVLVVDWLRSALTVWAGRSPPTTLAFATGGVVGVALAWAVGLGVTLAEFVVDVPVSARAVTPGVTVAVGAGLLAAVLLTAVPERLAWLVGVRRASGFAGGAAALFVAALAVPLFGLSGDPTTEASTLRGLVPLAAVVGVAASVLVWDLGENAVALRDQLGRETGTREAELTHAVSSGLVATGAVVLAAGAYYLAGPLLFTGVELGPLQLDGGVVDIEPERAFVALGLTIVAVLAFGVLVDRGQDPGPK